VVFPRLRYDYDFRLFPFILKVKSSLGGAGALRTSSFRVKPGGTFVCARRKAK